MPSIYVSEKWFSIGDNSLTVMGNSIKEKVKLSV